MTSKDGKQDDVAEKIPPAPADAEPAAAEHAAPAPISTAPAEKDANDSERRGTNDAEPAGKDLKHERQENLRFLLGQKLATLNATGNVCITWWVSSIGFCIPVFAAAWLIKDDIAASRVLFFSLGLFFLIFLGGVVFFGASILLGYLDEVSTDISKLAERLYQGEKEDDKIHFSAELSGFKLAMLIGTASFSLILVAWYVLCLWLLATR